MASETFDFVIETTTSNQVFTFYLHDLKNINIDWGDGESVSDITAGKMRPTHTYIEPGFYTNKISGSATWLAFGVVNTTPALLRDILTPLYPAVQGINKAESMFAYATGITKFTCEEWFDEVSGAVTSMVNMFRNAKNFNGSVAGWSVGQVETMSSMFNGANSFNQDLDHWDVGNVTTMANMFRSATVFNGKVGKWDVSNVKDMSHLFVDAAAFNQDISGWDVSSATTMYAMFARAYAFKGDISRWKPLALTDATLFMTKASLPTPYYNYLLMRWSKLSLLSSVVFDGGNSKYDFGRPEEGRKKLTDTFAWTVTDGGSTEIAYKEPGTAVMVR